MSTRVYADGIYDLFHYGHAKSLEQAKKLFPNTHLIVGCCNDELTRNMKGPTVLNQYERYESLRHCKWVDEIIEDAPWIIDDNFLKKYSIDYVAHDDVSYSDNDIYLHVKSIGKFKETKRTQGISTTEIIKRILKNYNVFIVKVIKHSVKKGETKLLNYFEKLRDLFIRIIIL